VVTTRCPSAVGLFNCHVRLVIRQARGRWGTISVDQCRNLHGKSREFTVDMKDSPRTLDELDCIVRGLALSSNAMQPGTRSRRWVHRRLAQPVADCNSTTKTVPVSGIVSVENGQGHDKVPGIEPSSRSKGLAIVSNNTSEAARGCRGVHDHDSAGVR